MDFQEYFQSYKNYFWQWEEADEVIGIPNGSTIAYREYIADILEHLSTQGFPPFGSLLLTLVATNRLYGDDIGMINSTISDHLIQKGFFTHDHSELLGDSIKFLRLLATLPQEYKEGKKRTLVLQTLFSDCHNRIASRKAKQILRSYNTNKHGEGRIYQKKEFSILNFVNDFRTLALLNKTYPNATALLEKIAQLPDIKEKVLLEEDQEQLSDIDIIEQLVSNTKTFHIGSLLKRIWSGLNIPFHNVLPSQQPIGGISDLTNKGDFDRLLISEFANDDLVFLSRLANNEALYLNREVPPQDNDLERVILIDASIKTWGTPKTVAHALLLAVAKHPKTDIRCTAFGVGNHYYPMYFETVDDIIDSLQILDGCLHPVQGIEAFFKDQESQKNREVILISSSETLAVKAFSKMLNDYQASFQYLIYTNSEGGIDLYKRQQKSIKHIQHLQLPLEELWAKPPVQKVPSEKWEEYSVYPILFPAPTKTKKALKTDCGQFFLFTPEKSLLRLYSKDVKARIKGWEFVYDGLPGSVAEFEIGMNKEEEFELLTFHIQKRDLILTNLATREIKKISWNDPCLPDIKEIFSKERFYVFGNSQSYVVSSEASDLHLSPIGTEKASILRTEANKKAEELNTFAKEVWNTAIVLRNITTVFINEVGNLVFNIHELRINDHGVIKLEKTGFLKKEFEAVLINQTEFVFENGSKVKINRSGMITLNGGEKVEHYGLALLSTGTNKLEAIKIIKEEIGLTLYEARNAIDALNSYILKGGCEKAEAERLGEQLRMRSGDIKTKVVVQTTDSIYIPSVLNASLGVATQNNFSGNTYYQLSEQSTMKPALFWQEFITPFIENVKQYGA